MPLISYSVGMTMHLGDPGNNEYIKKTIEVKDFDTSLPFEDQIQQVHATYIQLAQWSDEMLGNAILEALKKESA